MSGRYIRSLSLAILVTAAAASGIASAQQGLVAPRPLTSPQPPQPTNAAGTPVEGWVTVRYSVGADGKPSGVHAVDVMPPTIDPAPTVAAVSGWTFSPGLQNGRPIDWHNSETVVTFRLQSGPEASSPEFSDRYGAIAEMLAADPIDFAAANAASQALIGAHSTRLADLGLALTQAAVIHYEAKDPHSALAAMRRATDPRVPMLGGTELFPAVQLRLQLENDLGRIDDALETYGRLAKGLGPRASDAVFAQLGAELRMKSSDDEFLAISGRLDGGSWRIDADRRYFFLSDVENGSVNTIVAECDTRRIELPFDPDDNYGLPDGFGNCTLFVEGAPGTTFYFVAVLPPEE